MGNLLSNRSERTSSKKDADRAIEAHEEAIKAMPDSQYTRLGGKLNNLGIALQIKFDLTNSVEDLDRAIVAHEEAVQLTPAD